MKPRTNQKVIHPHHGAVNVESRETKALSGERVEYVTMRTLHLDNPMVISMPIRQLEENGIRRPIASEEMEDIFDLLRKRDIREPDTWNRRYKNHSEKLRSGDIYELSEVVRNLGVRKNGSGLSPGEQKMYEKALKQLASELSIPLKKPLEKAQNKIEKLLEDDIS